MTESGPTYYYYFTLLLLCLLFFSLFVCFVFVLIYFCFGVFVFSCYLIHFAFCMPTSVYLFNKQILKKKMGKLELHFTVECIPSPRPNSHFQFNQAEPSCTQSCQIFLSRSMHYSPGKVVTKKASLNVKQSEKNKKLNVWLRPFVLISTKM